MTDERTTTSSESTGEESPSPATAADEPGTASRSSPEPIRCPACDAVTSPARDRCDSCGSPLDAERTTSLAIWEWGGALAAMFGFFLTPILSGPIALFCAFKIYDYKPRAAWGILAVVFATIVFWIVLPVLLLP